MIDYVMKIRSRILKANERLANNAELEIRDQARARSAQPRLRDCDGMGCTRTDASRNAPSALTCSTRTMSVVCIRTPMSPLLAAAFFSRAGGEVVEVGALLRRQR